MDKLLSEATPEEMMEQLRHRGIHFVFGMLVDITTSSDIVTCCNCSEIIGLGLCELLKDRVLNDSE